MLRELRAANPSAMTLDGTRTWIIGRRRPVIIDPGPALADHIAAIARAVAGADVPAILLTHDHSDHGAGAADLARRLHAPVRGLAAGTLADGDTVPSDAGEVTAIHTPGHTPDHASFHWTAASAVFCGDLMMGGLDSALVAPPEGSLSAYLASLERLRSLAPRVIHPAHGPSFHDPAAAIDRYIAHRNARIRSVLASIANRPLSASDIANAVYGETIPESLRDVAARATLAYLEHLEQQGRVVSSGGSWRLAD